MMVKDRSQAGGAGNGCRDSVGAGGKRVPAVVVESVALCDAARALSARMVGCGIVGEYDERRRAGNRR